MHLRSSRDTLLTDFIIGDVRQRIAAGSLWLKRNLCGSAATLPKIRPVVSRKCLFATSSWRNVGDRIVCDFDHTCGEGEEREMNNLANIVDRRPMLRVSGEILLAFCFATPLVLLLCFLV
jgi:hypothetical protein